MPKTKITNQDYSKWWGEFLKISSLDWQDLLDSQSEKPLPSNIPMDILTEEFDKDPLKFILFSGTLPQREASGQQEAALNARHYKECIEKRGLNIQWVLANCKSTTSETASQYLGYTAQSDGIWLEGCNHQSQYKPDKPWKKEGDKKAPKYRSPLGDYDAMLPTHPTDPHYWNDIEALKSRAYQVDGHPCLIITEGFFKAIAGCASGVSTIALLGVEMGLTSSKADPQGKRYLVPTLERYAKAGFGFIIAFDADCTTNPSVIGAQRTLVHQLKRFKVPVYNATGLWSVAEGKGMDDYIQAHGAARFKREVMGKVVNIESWEKQFKQDTSSEKADRPNARKTALEISERHRHEWAYHNEQQTWRRFNGRVWEALHEKVFGQIVFNEVEAMGIDYQTDSFVENVIKTLERRLLVPEWKTADRMKWIAFSDCVLEVDTGVRHDHAPGFRFTSYLKRDYTPLSVLDPSTSILEQLRINAPQCYSWLVQVQGGDPAKVLKLLALINGVIKFRFFDLQMFVQLYGPPGTGKSTFARLLQGVVGKGNYQGSRLSKLNDDNEIAKLINAQLVVCPDESKQIGDFQGLKSLTGGDPISYREVYKTGATGFFYGTVVLISNVPLFAGDTSGVDRRQCLVTFDAPIPDYMRDASIEKRMESELSALSAVALLLDDKTTTALIQETGSAYIPDFQRQKWLHKTTNDSVALFLEERLIYDPASSMLLGGKNGNAHSTVYGAYLAFMEENNSKGTFTLNNFRQHLVSVCREAGWGAVDSKRGSDGMKLVGIRLRSDDADDNRPRISESFSAAECRQCNPSVGGDVGSEPLSSKTCVGSVGSSGKLFENPKENFSNSKENSPPNNKVNDAIAYTPTQPLPDNDSSLTPPSTLGLHCLHSAESPLRVGSRVWWDNCPGHCSWMNPFTITAIDGDMAHLDFYSKLVPTSMLRQV